MSGQPPDSSVSAAQITRSQRWLARLGVQRWISLAAFVLAPIAVVLVYAFQDLLWLAAVSAAGWFLAGLAVGLLRGRHTTGLRVLTAQTAVVTASSERIPVGIDGKAVSLPVPGRWARRDGSGEETHASLLRAGQRASPRAGPGHGAVAADNDLRRGALGGVVGH